MKKVARLLWFPVIAIAVACSSVSSAVDYDHTINWSQFHSFQLMDGTKSPDTFTQKRIDDGITSALTSKGWTAVTSNPDVQVFPHVVLSQEKQWNAERMGGFGYRMGGGMAQATQTNIPIGTLIVDMVNPKTKEMIWRGTAQDQVSGNGSDNGKIQQAIQDLFKNFPPQPGS
jgi:hypothetical protein